MLTCFWELCRWEVVRTFAARERGRRLLAFLVMPLLLFAVSAPIIPAESVALLLQTWFGVFVLILFPFAALSSLLASAVAGERERGTLEVWLLAPVPDWMLALAKVVPYWLVGLLYDAALVSAATGVAALAGQPVPLRGLLMSLVFAASGSLTVMALQVSISAWAESTAVAQQFVVLLLLLPGLAAFAIEPVTRFLFHSLDSFPGFSFSLGALPVMLLSIFIVLRAVRRDRLVLRCSQASNRSTRTRR